MYPNPPLKSASVAPTDAAVTSAPTKLGESGSIAAGTKITVELSDVIDSEISSPGQFIHCRIVGDVKGPDGKVGIPDRSSAVIAVMDSGRTGSKSKLVLGLYQVTVNDQSYLLNHGAAQSAVVSYTDDTALGMTHRSVHLQRRTWIEFTLSETLSLKR